MSETQDGQGEGPGEPGAAVEDLGLLGRARARLGNGEARARSAADRHVSIAVPFRAAERNRRVAASVIAGGIAYRLFLWLLPFGLIVGGVLGLGDADGIEEAVGARGSVRGGRRRDRGYRERRRHELLVAPPGGACRFFSGRAIRARKRCSSSTGSSGTRLPREPSPSRARSSSPTAVRVPRGRSLTWWIRDERPRSSRSLIPRGHGRSARGAWLVGSRMRLPHGRRPGRRSCRARACSRQSGSR